jgi:CPA1 family monovalent cation:H+ antiporter
MDLLVPIVLGVAAIVAVTVLSRRLGVAAPLLLVLVGVGVSLIPAVPDFTVPPELILGVVLPPLLYSAAVNLPAMDFRRDFRMISGLSVALVVVTSFAIAVLLTWLVPDMPFALAVAVGAIVSPTDAVATSIVKRMGISNRVITVLEGESLLNDATALVLLRSAIAVTAGTLGSGAFAGVTNSTAIALGTSIAVALDFAFAAAVAVAFGLVVGWLNLRIRSRVSMPAASTAISFIVPFAAALPSEALGASGLVAAVTAGLVTGHGAPKRLTAEDRMTERTTWRTIELLLEGSVFLVMGLQLSAVMDDVATIHDSVLIALALGGMLVVVVLIARTGFISVTLLVLRARMLRSDAHRAALDRIEERIDHRNVDAEQDARAVRRTRRYRHTVAQRRADLNYFESQALGPREGAVLVWAGMRGAVTLAAAQTLPAETDHRSLIILTAFVVAAGTLLLQGGTLPWLVRALHLSEPDAAAEAASARERLALRHELIRVALDRLKDPDFVRADGTRYSPAVLAAFEHGGYFGGKQRGDDDDDAIGRMTESMREHRELRLALIAAQRDELLRLRSVGDYSSAALASVLTVLDADELGIEARFE